MPAAWIGAGAAALGAIGSLSGGGGSSGGQVAQGAANIAGGALSANEAQFFGSQLAGVANPFGQYMPGFGAQLAARTNAGQFGNAAPSSLGLLGQFAMGNTLPQATALSNMNLGGQIQNLVDNPDSIYQTQQYKSAFGQGQNAVNATLAAQGLNASGNQLAALQNYGQSFGQQAYNTQLSQLSGLYGQSMQANQQAYGQLANNFNSSQQADQQAFGQLSQLSGLATGSPTAAAAAMANVFGNVNSSAQSIGQGVGQLASGLGGILGNLGGSNSFAGAFGGGTNTSSDIFGSGGLFGTSAGIDNGGGFSFGGSNPFGFTE